MEKDLARLFKQSSSITFISGRRDSGKTDFAFQLLDTARNAGLLDKIASNVRLRKQSNIEVNYIPYYDRLQVWLRTGGKKGFLLDELGKHLNRMRFMTQKSKLILDTCQLIRKYDAHLIGCAPSADLINKLFLNTDILDCYMVKTSRKIAWVSNYVTRESYTLEDIPRTRIPFITKDIATFEVKDPNFQVDTSDLPVCCRTARLFIKHRSLRKVAKIMDVSHMTVSNRLKIHEQHSDLHVETVKQEHSLTQ